MTPSSGFQQTRSRLHPIMPALAVTLGLVLLGGCTIPGDGWVAQGLSDHMYLQGSRRALDGDTNRALTHWRRAAAAGHPRAAYQMALLHGSDVLGERDQPRALDWAAKARDGGFAPGGGYIGASLLHGWGGLERDPAAAEAHLRRALAEGDERAAADLGALLLRHADSRRQGLAILTEAAEDGDARAQWRLGTALLDSDLGRPDPARAESLLNAALNAGEARALVPLARLAGLRGDAAGRRTLIDRALDSAPAHVQVALAKALLDPDDAIGPNPAQARRLLELAAASGRHQAHAALGKLLATGAPGVPPDPAAAVAHLTAASAAGNAEAAYALARLARDQGRDDAAQDWFMAAAARGHKQAHVDAARLLIRRGDPGAVRLAVDLLADVAADQDAAALELAKLARVGVAGVVSPDPALARRWLAHVRTHGRPTAAAQATNRLARMTLTGDGAAPDPPGAAALFYQAAQAGHAWSGLELARLYDSGGDGIARDPARAAAWYRWAAAEGVAEADTALGRLHLRTATTRGDIETALAHFTRAAEAGHAWAVFDAARLIDRGGPGRPADPAGARDLYLKAAALGVNAAPGALASLYEDGRGVAPDPARALTLYHQGARAGNAWATYKVGELLAEGHGVAADPDAARAWLRTAQNKGVAQAAPMLARLDAGTVGPFGLPSGNDGQTLRIPVETVTAQAD